jgi:hypothetical protein
MYVEDYWWVTTETGDELADQITEVQGPLNRDFDTSHFSICTNPV